MFSVVEKLALEREMALASELPASLYCRPVSYSVERWGDRFRVVCRKSVGGNPGKPDTLSVRALRAMYGEDFCMARDEETGELYDWADREREERLQGRHACNVSRARSRVQELAACNEWEWFVTLTLNAEKQDRFDIQQWKKDLGNWIGNYNKKYGAKLRYLIVPEQHKDGAWHAHGLFMGIAPESLVKNEHGYMDMPYYAARFGFISLDRIRDRSRCASYVAKYVTKEFADTGALAPGEHMYYASRGLNGKQLYLRGSALLPPGLMWENDYVAIEWSDDVVGAYDLVERLEVK